MGEGNQNGWNEYSRLVLKELETLADSIAGLRSELQEVKQELAKMHAREDKVDELKQWKERLDEVCSPPQLKELITEVENLKTFKTKAIAFFTAAQIATALFAWAVNLF